MLIIGMIGRYADDCKYSLRQCNVIILNNTHILLLFTLYSYGGVSSWSIPMFNIICFVVVFVVIYIMPLLSGLFRSQCWVCCALKWSILRRFMSVNRCRHFGHCTHAHIHTILYILEEKKILFGFIYTFSIWAVGTIWAWNCWQRPTYPSMMSSRVNGSI